MARLIYVLKFVAAPLVAVFGAIGGFLEVARTFGPSIGYLVAGAIAVVVTLLSLALLRAAVTPFSSRGTSSGNPPRNGSVITTINQSGGQVAHSITNVGSVARRLSEGNLAALEALARRHPGAGVQVSMILGDVEAAQLVAEIRQAAQAGGWGWIARNQSVYDRNPRGVIICAHGDSPLLRDTAQWAIDSGFKPIGSFKTKAKDLEIIIGRNLQPGEESGWDR